MSKMKNSSGRHNFQDKICVVTGAGRGLGRTVARMFIESGAKVAYLSLTPHADLLDELKDYGEQALFVSVDVSLPGPVQRAFKKVHKKFGSVDILINNAGIARSGRIEEITPEAWDQVMAHNIRSQFLCIQASVSYMKKRQYGKIVNISSIAGRDKSIVLGCSYSTSKAAIIGLTRHVATEVAAYGINVNCVCPSQLRTPMLESVLTPELENVLLNKIPLGYIAQPEQIAQVILFLASDEASYMTGAVVDVNGGLL